LVIPTARASAATLPSGFQDTVVIEQRTNPTVLQFAPDGRIFVGEKSGRIYVYNGLGSTPTLFADLSAKVDDYWDRGLLGLAVSPNFPSDPSVYVLYAYDAPIGGTAPRWNDACPSPPGPTTDGCLVSGRLSRLRLATGTNTSDGTETVLINDWCQQFPSHSIGTILFGNDGYLYASGGDGASFDNADWGQFGATNPGGTANPCGDPPGAVGTALTPPAAEGGALRSQSVRRTDGPATLGGAIIRIDPQTGAGAPGNPFATSPDVNKQRIIASGMRNPFRFAARPGTDQLWVGDVGWGTWEEIDRVADLNDSVAENFGWPCYEGTPMQSGYQSAGLSQCSTLYSAPGSVVAPVYAYNHGSDVVTGDGCLRNNGSSITGVAFYGGGSYPSGYNGALFFADHTRNCIWSMMPGSDGSPNPNNIQTFVSAAANPVDLKIGPNGDLFYVDMEGGKIHRVVYTPANQPPAASISANPTSGSVPLTVNFSGTGSSDPNGDPLSYSWDLNGDGVYGDATTVTTSYTYTQAGVYTVQLRVTDPQGAVGTASRQITAGGNTPPVAVIDTPAPSLRWRVGDTIAFSGHATDAQDGTLPASALRWDLVIHHCSTDCHEHLAGSQAGVATGTVVAPDHEYPSWLELRLTATDSGGLTSVTSVRLDPQTVDLTFRSNPAGLRVVVGAGTSGQATPFTKTFIVRATVQLSAPTPQDVRNGTYFWQSWSDGGSANHVITAPAAATTYTAVYRKR
jgi:glucose/arabinose dehydrogenase